MRNGSKRVAVDLVVDATAVLGLSPKLRSRVELLRPVCGHESSPDGVRVPARPHEYSLMSQRYQQ